MDNSLLADFEAVKVYFLEVDKELFEKAKQTIMGSLSHVDVIRCSPKDFLKSTRFLNSSSLVIFDLDCPNSNSLDLLDKIQQETSSPIIVLEDINIGTNRLIKALHLGATDYLFKPIQDSRLISTIITHSRGVKYVC